MDVILLSQAQSFVRKGHISYVESYFSPYIVNQFILKINLVTGK